MSSFKKKMAGVAVALGTLASASGAFAQSAALDVNSLANCVAKNAIVNGLADKLDGKKQINTFTSFDSKTGQIYASDIEINNKSITRTQDEKGNSQYELKGEELRIAIEKNDDGNFQFDILYTNDAQPDQINRGHLIFDQSGKKLEGTGRFDDTKALEMTRDVTPAAKNCFTPTTP